MRWIVIISSVIIAVVIVRHYLGLHRSRRRAYHLLASQRHKLRKAEKMASLGTVSAGLAHELSTPLGAVSCMTSSQRAAREKLLGILHESVPDLGSDPRVRKCLDVLTDGDRVVTAGMEQVHALLQELRNYAVNETSDPVPSDLHERLDGALLLVRNRLKQNIEVQREYADLPEVPIHPVRFNQVVLNLLINAARAMPDGGVLTVGTEAGDDGVTITIADTGVGIPRENLERIFEYGFTTHAENGGTGLGLAIAKDVVLMHGGDLSVESAPGEGTVFRIRLPWSAPQSGPNDPSLPWNDGE